MKREPHGCLTSDRELSVPCSDLSRFSLRIVTYYYLLLDHTSKLKLKPMKQDMLSLN